MSKKYPNFIRNVNRFLLSVQLRFILSIHKPGEGWISQRETDVVMNLPPSSTFSSRLFVEQLLDYEMVVVRVRIVAVNHAHACLPRTKGFFLIFFSGWVDGGKQQKEVGHLRGRAM